jgi:hypothetical protein
MRCYACAILRGFAWIDMPGNIVFALLWEKRNWVWSCVVFLHFCVKNSAVKRDALVDVGYRDFAPNHGVFYGKCHQNSSFKTEISSSNTPCQFVAACPLGILKNVTFLVAIETEALLEHC